MQSRHMESPTCTREVGKHLDFQVDSLLGLYDAHPPGKHLQKFEICPLDWLTTPPNCFGGRGTAVLGSLTCDDGVYRDFVYETSAGRIACQNEGDTTKCQPEYHQLNKCPKLLLEYSPLQGVACVSDDIGRRGSTYHIPGITVSKVLLPITTLAGADFVKAWLEIVRCTPSFRFSIWHADGRVATVYAYSRNNGLKYCDPSLRNIMYHNTLECGVLTDHDTSISLRDLHMPGAADKAGEIPFMAIELLTDIYWHGEVARVYRHELEAFIWILPFVFLAYQDKKFQQGSPVEEWMTSDYQHCREKKNDFRSLNRIPTHGTRCREDFKQHWPVSKRLLEWLGKVEITQYDADISLLTSYNSVEGLWPCFTAELDKLTVLASSMLISNLPGLIAELELHGTLNLV